MYVCMYDVRHDIKIPCTRYVAINRLYLIFIYHECVSITYYILLVVIIRVGPTSSMVDDLLITAARIICHLHLDTMARYRLLPPSVVSSVAPLHLIKKQFKSILVDPTVPMLIRFVIAPFFP